MRRHAPRTDSPLLSASMMSVSPPSSALSSSPASNSTPGFTFQQKSPSIFQSTSRALFSPMNKFINVGSPSYSSTTNNKPTNIHEKQQQQFQTQLEESSFFKSLNGGAKNNIASNSGSYASPISTGTSNSFSTPRTIQVSPPSGNLQPLYLSPRVTTTNVAAGSSSRNQKEKEDFIMEWLRGNSSANEEDKFPKSNSQQNESLKSTEESPLKSVSGTSRRKRIAASPSFTIWERLTDNKKTVNNSDDSISPSIHSAESPANTLTPNMKSFQSSHSTASQNANHFYSQFKKVEINSKSPYQLATSSESGESELKPSRRKMLRHSDSLPLFIGMKNGLGRQDIRKNRIIRDCLSSSQEIEEDVNNGSDGGDESYDEVEKSNENEQLTTTRIVIVSKKTHQNNDRMKQIKSILKAKFTQNPPNLPKVINIIKKVRFSNSD